MKYRFVALLLVAVLMFSLCGCDGIVSEIAGNVADAAMKELEQQVKNTLQEYKVEIVEVKSAVGKLNGSSDSNAQFFCGVLVRSNSDALPKGCANALSNVFDRSGIQTQTESSIENELLQKKTLFFKHTDYSAGNYYLIWVYTDSLTEKLSELELPDLSEDWLPISDILEEGIG